MPLAHDATAEHRFRAVVPWALCIALTATFCGCLDSNREEGPTTAPAAASDLVSQGEQFARGVEQVTEGVYVAIGYGLANSVLLEGTDGVVIVDAMEGRPQAEAVWAAFREITSKPVKALVLTHNHADHVFGGQVFTEGRDDIPVYAHETTGEHIDRIISVVRDATYTRSMRMFGQALPDTSFVNCGIGPRLDYHAENMALARPTATFSDSLEVTVAGLRIVLFHNPGETPDQIAVWLPDKKVLLPADNIYRAFPNLYTIRGTPYRDVMEWVASLDRMRDLGAEFLVPSHTRPLSGEDAIAETLTAYRDAIQFVHDQTVRGLNLGWTPDEIVERVRLPSHLADHPWLQEYYGTVAWSARGVFDGYLGWFDGDATSLNPLAPTERARRFSESFTRGRPLAEQAVDALRGREYQWAAELARMWTRLEPNSPEARNTLAACFEGLASEQQNANARNYYLTQASEWRGSLRITPPDASAPPDGFVDSLPIDAFMRAMPTRLDPEKAGTINEIVLFHFTDLGMDYTVHVRRGVAEVRPRRAANPDMRITTTTTTWKRIATNKANPALAFAAGEVQVDGGIVRVVNFLRLFER